LVRAAQAERPELDLRLLDLDENEPPASAFACLPEVLGSDEPQLARRAGKLRAPRLTRDSADLALPPQAGDWSLQIAAEARAGLQLVSCARAELAPGEVRIAVRAAALNERDLRALSSAAADSLGVEGAGTVIEVAPDVSDFAPGQRVMGLLRDAFGPSAIADRRQLVAIPAGLTFAQAAGVPVAFLTAYAGLVELGRLQRGQRVLIDAAGSGVGMAAVQLAQRLGAEVFATADSAHLDALRALG
jgi:NADPH:quinone reductase-like Zn-dependent oxidoreductase